MSTMDDKENVAPLTASSPLPSKSGSLSPKRGGARKGRSKSIGPGGLDLEELDTQKQEAKNRRKSTYVPATKSIISSDVEKAERQAARRKTLANRRVSFAPEATLHTWDVVEFMRDQTISTDSSDSTRRTSKGSPFKRAAAPDSDPPSSPSAQEDAPLDSPAHETERRRNSGIPSRIFNESDNASSNGSESSEVSESGEEDAEGSDDDTGTAMSLDMDSNTVQSFAESEGGSTDSSARLEAALKQAAETAGTRGIEYDEYGDESMEIAEEEITNAFKPWVEQRAAAQPMGSASFDQENVNPFSPAFKAQLISGTVNRPATLEEEETGDLSMDMTRAVGGIVNQPPIKPSSSPLGDATMEFTQAIGMVQQPMHTQSPQEHSGQKRRRSTTEAGSPGIAVQASRVSKRRRSSVARSSMGEDEMDLTIAVGGIQSSGSPVKPLRRKSAGKRRSSGEASEQEEVTMDFTRAIGGVKSTTKSDNTGSSFDENEELTMELTTVLGSIKAAERAADEPQPSTPVNQSPVKERMNTTPKDQDRFKDAPDSGPKKLLTPIFQKQILHSAEKKESTRKSPKSAPPIGRTRSSVARGAPSDGPHSLPTTPKVSPSKEMAPLRKSPERKSPLRIAEGESPALKQTNATPDSTLRDQLDAQLQEPEPETEPSPTAQKQQRSSPIKIPSTPLQAEEPTQDGRRLVESIKSMSTPRKETLKSVTPKKQVPPSPKQSAPLSSQARPKPQIHATVDNSPAKQLSEDLNRMQTQDGLVEKVQLNKFLETAGIRFMDLTTTKRRMTTAVTPSKAKKMTELQDGPGEVEIDLESAAVAGSCTLPELEMYEHACHELKRYISDGKRVIKEIEVGMGKKTPPLVQAYMAAGSKRRLVLDAQMRDIKTHARYQSKETWYAWRTQLLGDLTKALSGIGEGMVKDDETLQRAQQILENILPGMMEHHNNLQAEAEKLEQDAAAVNEDEKEELETARERLLLVESEMLDKQKLLEQLRAEMEGQQSRINELEESKEEFTAAIQEADRVREACRGVSINEITNLKESIRDLEQTHGWSITSASSSPATVTMTYKSQIQLFFRPAAFQSGSRGASNAPISLTYVAEQQPGTTLRFFLQLLRASLQALPQPTTPIPSLLNLISNGWDTALAVAEAERRLDLEAMTESRIVSDERLAISSTILLPLVRSKVRLTFEVAAAVVEGDEIELSTTVEPKVKVVYGEEYNETKMTAFIEKEIASAGFEGWSVAAKVLKDRLIARGTKGAKK